jgi:hypothetical protein
MLLLALSGCGESHRLQTLASQNTASPTDQELALARVLLGQELREERQQDTTLKSVSVSAEAGRVKQPNTGYACDSGRLLHIKLIGDFPRIGTTGNPLVPGTTTPEDFTVHAVLLTADPKTEHVCLIGVQTGDVEPEPGAVIIQ